jgi:hypothetical protein
VVRRRYGQRSLFEVLLPDGDKLWEPELTEIDRVLEDEDLLHEFQRALEQRRLLAGRLG